MLRTQFGRLPFKPGDYIVIPFGTTWQMQLDVATVNAAVRRGLGKNNMGPSLDFDQATYDILTDASLAAQRLASSE